MQAPKRKTSKSKRNMRRSHDGLRLRFMAECPSCGAPVRSHSVCLSCGEYRSRKIIPELSQDKDVANA